MISLDNYPELGLQVLEISTPDAVRYQVYAMSDSSLRFESVDSNAIVDYLYGVRWAVEVFKLGANAALGAEVAA